MIAWNLGEQSQTCCHGLLCCVQSQCWMSLRIRTPQRVHLLPTNGSLLSEYIVCYRRKRSNMVFSTSVPNDITLAIQGLSRGCSCLFTELPFYSLNRHGTCMLDVVTDRMTSRPSNELCEALTVHHVYLVRGQRDIYVVDK